MKMTHMTERLSQTVVNNMFANGLEKRFQFKLNTTIAYLERIGKKEFNFVRYCYLIHSGRANLVIHANTRFYCSFVLYSCVL